MSHTPGDRYDGWGIARGLLMLGNLPACLGYVGLVVTMLHSRTASSRIRVLAPLGRMALTNYLMQSLICMTFFYGFGLGHWGMPRAQQVLFVARGVRRADRLQPLVAGALPLRADGMAVARLHLPAGAADARRRRVGARRRRLRPSAATSPAPARCGAAPAASTSGRGVEQREVLALQPQRREVAVVRAGRDRPIGRAC